MGNIRFCYTDVARSTVSETRQVTKTPSQSSEPGAAFSAFALFPWCLFLGFTQPTTPPFAYFVLDWELGALSFSPGR